MEHGVEYQAVLFCEDRMAAVGTGEKVPDEVIVAVTVLGGVIEGVAEGRQPGYWTLLHIPGCSTPPAQHAQQYESVALPVQPAHVNSAVDVTVLVGVGVAPKLSDDDPVLEGVAVDDTVLGGVWVRLSVDALELERDMVSVGEEERVDEAVFVSEVVWAAAKRTIAAAVRASTRECVICE